MNNDDIAGTFDRPNVVDARRLIREYHFRLQGLDGQTVRGIVQEALLRQLASRELGDRRDPELASSVHGIGEDLLLPNEPPCALLRTDTSDPPP